MTDKHIPASKLLALTKRERIDGVIKEFLLLSDLLALIDEAPEVDRRALACLKACEGLSTENLETNDPLIVVVRKYNLMLKSSANLPPPSPDLTNLVGELVKALEESNESIREGIESEMELEAEHSKYARVLCGKNDALVTRAKEYLK